MLSAPAGGGAAGHDRRAPVCLVLCFLVEFLWPLEVGITTPISDKEAGSDRLINWSQVTYQ